jgi:hypothetical protein
VFSDDTRYKLELALGDRGGFGFVRDLYVEQALPGTPVWVRAGQWKRPFNRQELVADFASEFNERAITAELAGGGRDVGVAIHDDYERSLDGVEWVVGVFNGFSGGGDRPDLDTTCAEDPVTMAIDCATPPPTNIPSDFGPAVVARVGWNRGGIKGYSEGDLEGGPLRLAIGASYKLDLADLSAGDEATVADNLSHGVEVDAMVKLEGASLEVGAYLMKLRSAAPRLGAFAQAGYMVIPARAQVAGRVAVVQTDGADDATVVEGRAAFSWFWQGHRWKLVTDAGALRETGEATDLQARAMAQLTF